MSTFGELLAPVFGGLQRAVTTRDAAAKTVCEMFFPPWFSHGFLMVFPWFSHGFLMVFPWFYHGFLMVLPMVFSCFFPTVEGPSRTFPLASPWIGFSAQLFSWRFSFVILALLWGFMAIYAALLSVESCPDGEQQS